MYSFETKLSAEELKDNFWKGFETILKERDLIVYNRENQMLLKNREV